MEFQCQVDEKEATRRINSLRGVFAVLIVFGHCMTRVSGGMPIGLFYLTAFFFIVSAWGLSYNYQVKENYLKGYLINKPFKLFLFALMCGIAEVFLASLLLKRKFEINLSLLTSFNWYIYEAIVFYIVFFFVYLWVRNKHVRFLLTLLISVAMGVFVLKMQDIYGTVFWVRAFYKSVLCFAGGIALHEYYS